MGVGRGKVGMVEGEERGHWVDRQNEKIGFLLGFEFEMSKGISNSHKIYIKNNNFIFSIFSTILISVYEMRYL